MIAQVILDGLIAGAMIGLGAIGITLTYSILRFANFAHGEFITWGAYAALGVEQRARRTLRAALAAPDRPVLLRLAAAAGAARRHGADRASGAAASTALLFGRLRRAAAPSSSW